MDWFKTVQNLANLPPGARRRTLSYTEEAGELTVSYIVVYRTSPPDDEITKLPKSYSEDALLEDCKDSKKRDSNELLLVDHREGPEREGKVVWISMDENCRSNPLLTHPSAPGTSTTTTKDSMDENNGSDPVLTHPEAQL